MTEPMLRRIPPWLRAAIITSAQVAAGYLLLIVLNLLFDISAWLSDPTNPVDLSTPAKLAVGVLITFITGVVTAVYRAIRPPQNTYPEMPTVPDPPKP